jgi:trk system potassium uptake protein TrkA
MPHFVVIGLSTFGTVLARRLYELGASVVAIDRDKERIQEIKDAVTRAYQADVTDVETLKRLVRDDTDAVIVSLGEVMEDAVMITFHLKQMGVREIIVKTGLPDAARVFRALGATETIVPEADIALRVAEELIKPQLQNYLKLDEEHVMVEVAEPASFRGRTLANLGLRQTYRVNLVAIRQTVPAAFIAVPPSDFVFKGSDVLVLLGRRDDIERLLEAER